MKRYFIITGTVTYAIKGRNFLRSKGYEAEMRRLTNISGNVGCGYGIYTNCEPDAAKELFLQNGIKFLGFSETV